MPRFSNGSIVKLASCDVRLATVLYDAIKQMDFTVLCGYRGKLAQEDAFKSGNSKLHFPHSKHNVSPSKAVDIAPYPIDWNNIERFKELAKIVFACAEKRRVKLRHGGEWGDWPHFELVE